MRILPIRYMRRSVVILRLTASSYGKLALFLALAALCLGFLQKAPPLFFLGTELMLLSLVLPDQRPGWLSKYPFVFTKLANPDFFGLRWLKRIITLFLSPPLLGRACIIFGEVATLLLFCVNHWGGWRSGASRLRRSGIRAKGRAWPASLCGAMTFGRDWLPPMVPINWLEESGPGH